MKKRAGPQLDTTTLSSPVCKISEDPSNRPLTPSLSPSEGERVPDLSAVGLAKVEGRVRGMVHGPMRAQKRKEAPHKPGGTSDIEHPTLNIEWQLESSLTSAFGVRCWTFDVFPRFRVSTRESSFRDYLPFSALVIFRVASAAVS